VSTLRSPVRPGRPLPLLGSVLLATALAIIVIPTARSAATGTVRQTSLPGPLYGVDAVGPDDVWAVGTRPDPNDPDEDIGLAEHWDGVAWAETPTPAFGDPIEGTLLDVSGTFSNDVWAVGSSGLQSFNDRQIVVEHWDGSAWAIVDAPNRSFNDELFGVVAISATNAWAVGGYDTGGTALNHMLIEHWDGQQWSVVPTPSFPNTELLAVDAVAANDVWAVGPAGTAMHYDGRRWSKVAIPDPGGRVESLNEVSAVASNDVWAVGTMSGGHPFDGLTFSIHWDGTRWSVVPSPSPKSGDEVQGVSALSGDEAWMVGEYFPDAFTNKPLTEHFSGGAWTVVPAPQTSNLDGVAAVASNDVWAVGSSIYHWDGSTWTIVVPG
jgi:hypothetical protein